MRTAVITDTNSGISIEEAAEMGIRSIPMPVLIDGEIYLEGVDLESKGFFASLTEGKAVTTSQPSPGVVCSAWEEALNEGFDNVVYLPMSSGLSHSCESAQLAAANYSGRVAVVDNGRVSVTLRAAVEDALSMANQGMPAAHIKSELERRAKLSSIYHACCCGARFCAESKARSVYSNRSDRAVLEGTRHEEGGGEDVLCSQA